MAVHGRVSDLMFVGWGCQGKAAVKWNDRADCDNRLFSSFYFVRLQHSGGHDSSSTGAGGSDKIVGTKGEVAYVHRQAELGTREPHR